MQRCKKFKVLQDSQISQHCMIFVQIPHPSRSLLWLKLTMEVVFWLFTWILKFLELVKSQRKR